MVPFQEYCQNELKKTVKTQLNIKNTMAVPAVTKIVINVGAGEATVNKNAIANITQQMGLIAGQKPVITKAHNSISAFKIRAGLAIGVKVTLRGKRMYVFLEKLVKIVLPRIRDFRGIKESAVDQHGNLNLGFSEQTLFPEIEYDSVDKLRGMQVTIVTNANNRKDGRVLFEAMGIPFHKQS